MSFYAFFDRIAPAGNKVMACLWNGAAGRKLVVNRVYRFNAQTSAQTGVLLEQELREVTARTAAGTAGALMSEDVDDAPSANILAEHGGTWTEGGRGLIHRFYDTALPARRADRLLAPAGVRWTLRDDPLSRRWR